MRKECEVSKEESDKLKVFEHELSLIPKDYYRSLTRMALCKVHPRFFTAPASSTGKYHPPYALGKGGLVRHTKACVVFAVELLALKQNAELNKHRSEIISALILHDTCKGGVNWDSSFFKHEHPLLVRELLKEDIDLSFEEWAIWRSICELIESHMGEYTTSKNSNIILPECQGNKLKEFVHMCDYLASRKDIGLYSLEPSKNSVNRPEVKSPVEKPVKWQNQICTKVQIETIETWLAKGGTQLDVKIRDKVNNALNNRGLTKGEASKLIGELKTAIDGKVTEGQLQSLHDVLKKNWLVSKLSRADVNDAQWALKNPDGMTKVRAREILSKAYEK